jgi:hypothetical protein
MSQPTNAAPLQLATLLKAVVEHYTALKTGKNIHFHARKISEIYYNARSITKNDTENGNKTYIDLIDMIYEESQEISKKQYEIQLREYLRDTEYIDDDVY